VTPDVESVSRTALLRGMGLDADGADGAEARHPYVHRTESVDYGIILSGEIDMVLDDSEVRLKAHDVVIQQGTTHAWLHRSDKLCQIAFILIDGLGLLARRSTQLPQAVFSLSGSMRYKRGESRQLSG
jgi:hypothetical protein